MKIKSILTILFFTLFTSITTKAQQANDIIGVWLSEKQDAKIEIYKAINGKYYGKLIWGARMYEADGKTSKLAKNGKPFKDLLMLQNFEFIDNEWTNGTIYDPEEGKTYSCTMKKNGNSLAIRGYLGISLFGRTTTWTKISK